MATLPLQAHPITFSHMTIVYFKPVARSAVDESQEYYQLTTRYQVYCTILVICTDVITEQKQQHLGIIVPALSLTFNLVFIGFSLIVKVAMRANSSFEMAKHLSKMYLGLNILKINFCFHKYSHRNKELEKAGGGVNQTLLHHNHISSLMQKT